MIRSSLFLGFRIILIISSSQCHSLPSSESRDTDQILQTPPEKVPHYNITIINERDDNAELGKGKTDIGDPVKGIKTEKASVFSPQSVPVPLKPKESTLVERLLSMNAQKEPLKPEASILSDVGKERNDQFRREGTRKARCFWPFISWWNEPFYYPPPIAPPPFGYPPPPFW